MAAGYARARAQRRLVCPVADLCNHEPAAVGTAASLQQPWEMASGGAEFRLLAVRPFAAGEPVSIPYGPYCDAELCVEYGFVLGAGLNPFDAVEVRAPVGARVC